MRKIFFILCAGFLLMNLACSKLEVTISLTSPQDKAVPFKGEYTLKPSGGTSIMEGTTPKDYTVSAKSGDKIEGFVYKNNTDLTDTLQLRILVNDEEKVNQRVTSKMQQIQFSIDIL